MQMDRRYRREWPCCNGPGGTVGGELPGRHGGVASVVQKQFAALGSICVKLNVGEGCQRAPETWCWCNQHPALVASVLVAKQGAPSVLVHFRQKTRGGCVSYWCGARKAVLRSQRWVWKRGFFSSGLMQRECECRGSSPSHPIAAWLHPAVSTCSRRRWRLAVSLPAHAHSIAVPQLAVAFDSRTSSSGSRRAQSTQVAARCLPMRIRLQCHRRAA